MSDRAAALAPYAQQLLYDRQVQAALRSAVDSGRGTVQRGRAKGPRKAVTDKKLRSHARQFGASTWQLWLALSPPPRRSRARWLWRIALVVIAGVSAYVALNAEARETVVGLVTNNASSATDQSQ